VAQYDVRAATLTSAFDVMHRIAPELLQRPPGTRLSATTNYRVSTNRAPPVALDEGPRTAMTPCAAGPVTVTLTQTITLPRWVYPAGTDAASIAQWVRFRTMLDRHEAGHAAVNTRGALIIRDSLAAVRAPCAQISRASATVLPDILAEVRAANARYDSVTDHGRRRGTMTRREPTSECRLQRPDTGGTRRVGVHGVTLLVPEALRNVASAPDNPYATTWSDDSGRSITLDFRLGAHPVQRFGLTQTSTCAGTIAGFAAELVRGRGYGPDRPFVVVGRWLGLGGDPSAPSGNVFSVIVRANNARDRDKLLSHVSTLGGAPSM
jgi:hypothetical protein